MTYTLRSRCSRTKLMQSTTKKHMFIIWDKIVTKVKIITVMVEETMIWNLRFSSDSKDAYVTIQKVDVKDRVSVQVGN